MEPVLASAAMLGSGGSDSFARHWLSLTSAGWCGAAHLSPCLVDLSVLQEVKASSGLYYLYARPLAFAVNCSMNFNAMLMHFKKKNPPMNHILYFNTGIRSN